MVRNLKREFGFLIKRCAIEGIFYRSVAPYLGCFQKGVFSNHPVAVLSFNPANAEDRETEQMIITFSCTGIAESLDEMVEVMKDLYEVFPETRFYMGYMGPGVTQEDLEGTTEEIKQKLYKF